MYVVRFIDFDTHKDFFFLYLFVLLHLLVFIVYKILERLDEHETESTRIEERLDRYQSNFLRYVESSSRAKMH